MTGHKVPLPSHNNLPGSLLPVSFRQAQMTINSALSPVSCTDVTSKKGSKGQEVVKTNSLFYHPEQLTGEEHK